jgi:hypothetical protein
MKQRYLFALMLMTILSFLSCRKERQTKRMYEDLFYGKWQTSYVDTISFASEGGKNIITYDPSLNPATPSDTKKEFIYMNDKLGIKDGLDPAGGFRMLPSFTWVVEGKTFIVKGMEWFPSLTAPLTYYTFTRIP